MTLATRGPNIAPLLESSKYPFIRGLGEDTFEAMTNKMIQIETYNLYKEKLTAALFGKFKRYTSS